MIKKFYKEDSEIIPAILYENSNPLDYTEVTNQIELKDLYIRKYKQQRIDGENYYLSFQAKLYLDVVNGLHTALEVIEFEGYIDELSNQIIKGNWLTAQTTCSELLTSGIFNTAKKAEIQSDIDTYVLNNY